MFFDLVHPTAATHGVLGAFAAESLTSETHLLGDGDDVVQGGERRRPGARRRRRRPGPRRQRRRRGAGGPRQRPGRRRARATTSSPAAPAATGSTAAPATTSWRGRPGADLGLRRQRRRPAGRRPRPGHPGRRARRRRLPLCRGSAAGRRQRANGGVFFGGEGHDTLYLAVSAEVRAQVAAELAEGAATQCLALDRRRDARHRGLRVRRSHRPGRRHRRRGAGRRGRSLGHRLSATPAAPRRGVRARRRARQALGARRARSSAAAPGACSAR